MIDIHSHILPSIDDGAISMHVAIDMLDAAAAAGFHTIVTTPHLDRRLDPAFETDVDSAFHRLTIHARDAGIALVQGFEIRLAPDLPDQLRCGDAITLGGANAALVDLPLHVWPHFVDETLFKMQVAGFRPVLAHPERYAAIQERPVRALRLVDRGIILQTTIGSYSGIFGRRAKQTAEKLLMMGTVHVVATDAHSASQRMAAVPAGLERLMQLVGEEQFYQLTEAAPISLLTGATMPDPVRGHTRSWVARIALRRP